MNLQLCMMMLAVFALFLSLSARKGNPSFALSMALMASNTNPLYERTARWFNTSLEDVEKGVKEGIDKMKDTVKGWVDELKEADNKKASKDDIEALKGEYKDRFEQLQKGLDDLQLEAKRLKESDGSTRTKSFKQQIEEQLNATTADGKTAVKSQLLQKNTSVNLEIKAAVNMTSSNTVASGSRIPVWSRDPGVAKAPDRQPFITDLITVASLGESDTASWVERVDRQGGAATTAEGTKYAQISTSYQEFSRSAEFITVFAKLSRKNLNDIDYLMGEIQSEIITSLELKADEQVFKGDGTSPNLKGILEYATAFAKPAGLLAVADASYFDVLATAATQVYNNLFTPTYIVMHPTDLLALNLKKDANDVYVMPPFWDMNGRRISGLPIVQNVGVTQGSFLVGDFTQSIFKVREGIELNIYDQNEDDAVKGFKTITGTMRGVHYIKGPSTKAFVKGTFAAGITALLA
ncbi:phage major capsid protein [Rudanella paleaurantiibacter]|uniref:Phage major capsid protein n=1 Tax=Rudanella paleaurantiibacter TaxID=2614655 RepID=A0A7J5TYE1_9BACT|nr:phage major capsid protein [Rudanella paleaurantiibacter]KAB7730143.1 phage major capsid protein [Rudanella paleaurantiibacter]